MATRKEESRERAQAELDTIDDSIENLDKAPPHPLLIVPRPMAFGAMALSVLGAVIGAAIGFGIGAVLFGLDGEPGLFVVMGAAAFAGLVAGGVMGGWAGGLGAKRRDEQRPSHAGSAAGTRPVRRGPQPTDKPIGWE